MRCDKCSQLQLPGSTVFRVGRDTLCERCADDEEQNQLLYVACVAQDSTRSHMDRLMARHAAEEAGVLFV